MAGSSKEKLGLTSKPEEESETQASEPREVFLRDGRSLSISDEGADQLVEIRSTSGLVELRVKLTDAGPVLQMESVRLQLKAAESVEIESKRIELKATEAIALTTGELDIKAEADVKVDASGAVHINGKMIYLN